MSRGAVLDFISRELGGYVEVLEATLSVGVSAGEVAGGDGERVGLVLVNLSTATIWVAPTPAVSSSRGIQIGSSWGYLVLNVRDDMILPSLQWYAVASAAASSLYVVRVRRFRAGS